MFSFLNTVLHPHMKKAIVAVYIQIYAPNCISHSTLFLIIIKIFIKYYQIINISTTDTHITFRVFTHFLDGRETVSIMRVEGWEGPGVQKAACESQRKKAACSQPGETSGVCHVHPLTSVPASILRASLVAQTAKNLPAGQETWAPSLSREDPLEKGMATHSSILAWRIPWREEPGGLQSMGSQRVEHD